MRLTGERALEMAGIGLADIDMIDLYSCFPSAVRSGPRRSAGARRSARPDGHRRPAIFRRAGEQLRPAFHRRDGGRLRERPGAYGLSTANGWFLTKQSVGHLFDQAGRGKWERQPPSVIQATIDALPHPEIVEKPRGRATIETYTVVHGREGVRMGIVIGRDARGRFVAQTPDDPAVLRDLESREGVGGPGLSGRTRTAFATSSFRIEP
jgi:acetyl-CoA C-acetyltransferase